MMNFLPNPGIRFAKSYMASLIQRIATCPMHHDSTFLQSFHCPQKFPRRHTPTDLIGYVADGKFPRQRCEIANTLVWIKSELPPFPTHQLGEHTSKIG